MGYSATFANECVIEDVKDILDEYKLPYRFFDLDGGARMLITKNWVYLSCYRQSFDCDGHSRIYSEKFSRETLFQHPMIWRTYQCEDVVIRIDTKAYNQYIKPGVSLFHHHVDDRVIESTTEEGSRRRTSSRVTVCPFWLKNECGFGMHCLYAHVHSHPVCKNFGAGLTCKYGYECKFSHCEISDKK